MDYTLQDKVEAAEKIVKMFHLERMAIFLIAIVSVVILLALAVYTFLTKNMTWDVFITLFLPTGGISFCCGLIMRMFGASMEFLAEELK